MIRWTLTTGLALKESARRWLMRGGLPGLRVSAGPCALVAQDKVGVAGPDAPKFTLRNRKRLKLLAIDVWVARAQMGPRDAVPEE